MENLMKKIKASWLKTKKSENGKGVKSNIKFVIKKYKKQW